MQCLESIGQPGELASDEAEDLVERSVPEDL
jgi:hypothetical protein